MRMLMLLFLLPATSVLHAQQVYKCSSGTDVAYQSQPCDQSQRTIRQWDATPAPIPASVQVAPVGKPASERTGSAKSRRPATASRGVRARTDPADRRCDAAKARREAKLKAVGLKRTFDLLRKLDDAVSEACK